MTRFIRGLLAAGMLLAICGTATACRRRSAAPPPEPAPPPEAPAAAAAPAAPATPQPAAYVPPPAPVAFAPVGSQPEDFSNSSELADLNAALEIYIAIKKRVPRDFNEFIQLTKAPVPPIPRGGRLYLDPAKKQILFVPPPGK